MMTIAASAAWTRRYGLEAAAALACVMRSTRQQSHDAHLHVKTRTWRYIDSVRKQMKVSNKRADRGMSEVIMLRGNLMLSCYLMDLRDSGAAERGDAGLRRNVAAVTYKKTNSVFNIQEEAIAFRTRRSGAKFNLLTYTFVN